MGTIMETIRQLFRHNFITTGALLTGGEHPREVLHKPFFSDLR